MGTQKLALNSLRNSAGKWQRVSPSQFSVLYHNGVVTSNVKFVKCDRLSSQLHIFLDPGICHLFLLKWDQEMFCQWLTVIWVRRFRKLFPGRCERYVKDCSGEKTWIYVRHISDMLIQGCLFCGFCLLIINAPLLARALEIMVLSSLLAIRMSVFVALNRWLPSLAASPCSWKLCRKHLCWQSLN